MDKKSNAFLALYMGILFAVVFTLVGGLISGFNWAAVPVQAIISLIIGVLVGLIIPIGDVGSGIASKICEPGTKGFSFVMFNVILIIMLVFMCPLMGVIFGSVLGGAPLAEVLPGSYSTFLPFYIVGSIVLQLFGEKIVALAVRTAHPKGK